MDVWAPRSLIPLQLLHSDPHTLIHTQSREPLYPRKELEMGSNEKTGQAALMRNGVTRQVYWSANCLYSTSHFIPLYLNFLTLVTSQTLLILPLPRLCFPLKIPQKSLVQPPNALPLHHVPYPMEWSSLVSEVIWRAASLPHGVSGPMAHGAESLLGQAWQGTGQELVFLTWTKINTWIHWASFVTVAWKTLRGDLLGCLDTKKKKGSGSSLLGKRFAHQLTCASFRQCGTLLSCEMWARQQGAENGTVSRQTTSVAFLCTARHLLS